MTHNSAAAELSVIIEKHNSVDQAKAKTLVFLLVVSSYEKSFRFFFVFADKTDKSATDELSAN